MPLLGDPANPAKIFPEPELLIRMESGQLDAGFFYRHEVVAHKVPFIELPKEINQSDPSLAGLYKEQKFTTDKAVTITASPIVFWLRFPSRQRICLAPTPLYGFSWPAKDGT
jgi:molybdate/tungstate transport system substrate-binding protein